MVKLSRSVLAVVTGLFVGFLAIMVGEMIGHQVSPPPPGMDMNDTRSMHEAMKSMPAVAFVMLLASWGVGTFAGAGVAAMIAGVGKIRHGLVVGGFFLAAGLSMILMMPHPLWFSVVGLAEFLPVAYLGARIASGRRRSLAAPG